MTHGDGVIQCERCGFTVAVPAELGDAAAWFWADDWLRNHFCDGRFVEEWVVTFP